MHLANHSFSLFHSFPTFHLLKFPALSGEDVDLVVFVASTLSGDDAQLLVLVTTLLLKG